MTNLIALWLGALIALAFAMDYAVFDWANTVFLLRKLMAFIEWLAFWR